MRDSAGMARQAQGLAAHLLGGRKGEASMDWAKNPLLESEADPVMGALRDLVEEIENSSFFDQYGHLLELSPAFVEARDLVHGYTAS